MRYAVLAALGFVGCSGAAAPASTASITVSTVPAVRGVLDRGMDPAVVAIEVGDLGVCSGVLIAPDVVLTARHCTAVIAPNATCPAAGPQVTAQLNPATLRVLMGDEAPTAVAAGLDVFVPPTDVLCDADIALLLLDRPIKTVTPAIVEGIGAAKGQHVRTVGYGGPGGDKLLREHVLVLQASASEFVVAEASCIGAGGAAAFDETTGHVVGTLARFGPCAGTDPYDVYTRADAFYSLIAQALASSIDSGKKQSHASTKDPTDIGGTCFTGSDCGAGVCIDVGTAQYCSRSCSLTDKCPAHYKCDLIAADQVCVQY